MLASVVTVAFDGVDARRVDVQVQQLSGDQGFFNIVGLPDKAVAESRERVRGAFAGIGLAMPSRRIIANLAPADLPKEGSHFDLPIALALLASMGVIAPDALSDWAALGELGLDGRIAPVGGTLPAAVAAAAMGLGLICPEANGPEAAWAGEVSVLAPRSLIGVINHFKGVQVLRAPEPGPVKAATGGPDLREVKGQESAKRALEVAAAGGHNLLFVGPPGSGKSMMAQRLPGLLPPLTPQELLETSMVWSVAGLIERGGLTRDRPFRSPHHSASMAALTGGGHRAKPGEASLAHNGVLFLDELPEYSPQALDSLRQPLETGEIVVARANAHVRYPARFQLIAAMNPCRCGVGGPGKGACGKAPRCQRDYQNRISGPLFDRIDLTVETPPVTAADMALPPPAEGTAEAAARVAAAREAQADRAREHGLDPDQGINARASGETLDRIGAPDESGRALLMRAAEAGGLTARGWTRTLRLARTIADLEGSTPVLRRHIAEALVYRRTTVGPQEAGAAPVAAETAPAW
ncbi:YifB family Mg chelatase-like AAA ATPase [Brevundimonas abyssalis]|uniref:MG(2+) chelatase family protein / comM-related protein n=1 Tax=Brevundimonas abyssalis TAR-001 TaxID=1391729 RepID=A0A8E0NAR6_9CAUL|nr:YifB family Mg chelatase-like AAA ATPase [Brevundimonas abyssalis]GAD57990.1 MG(2+) chelatase family protein / comM-related protein [Brevundimonas abyssalis TAR-001]